MRKISETDGLYNVSFNVSDKAMHGDFMFFGGDVFDIEKDNILITTVKNDSAQKVVDKINQMITSSIKMFDSLEAEHYFTTSNLEILLEKGYESETVVETLHFSFIIEYLTVVKANPRVKRLSRVAQSFSFKCDSSVDNHATIGISCDGGASLSDTVEIPLSVDSEDIKISIDGYGPYSERAGSLDLPLVGYDLNGEPVKYGDMDFDDAVKAGIVGYRNGVVRTIRKG